jgi:hypothetical protein
LKPALTDCPLRPSASPANRVEAGVSPAPPTPPIMRVYNGRFIAPVLSLLSRRLSLALGSSIILAWKEMYGDISLLFAPLEVNTNEGSGEVRIRNVHRQQLTFTNWLPKSLRHRCTA